VLKDSFAEIFIYCDFTVFPTMNKLGRADEAKNVVEIWKKCVDVQQHFNDLEMRIRTLAITVVGAFLAALSFTYQQGLLTRIFGLTVPTGLGLVVAAMFAWLAFYFMDRHWYHVLLRGAVKHAAEIEDKYSVTIPGIGLGKTISKASQNVRIFCTSMDSEKRLVLFYRLGFAMLVVVFIFLWFVVRKS